MKKVKSKKEKEKRKAEKVRGIEKSRNELKYFFNNKIRSANPVSSEHVYALICP